ncbi:MAG: iron export ABC transporter permease subunit FetB [Candidatus Zixiibacteriota bacterium]|nr:MAG: iron export ABC transporter permease subunit FetB [candidate division Zixibacteria bacterium]
MIDLGFTQVLVSALLVAIAIGVSLWWKIPVQKDMALGSVRAFVQLVAVGYALKYIFELESIPLILLVILVMILVAAHAASGMVKKLKASMLIMFVSITVGSIVTLGLLLLLDIITWEARYVIPLAGMIISNSMNASALTANRVVSDIRGNAPAIESALALGKTWREASHPFQKQAAIAGLLSTLNFLKTVGIVALPGAMTGMILAGAEPVKAVLLQIIVAFMLLSAVTITSVMTLELTVRRFFTSAHQLIDGQ